MKKEHYTLRLNNDFKSLETLNSFILQISRDHNVSQDILSRVKLSLEELIVNIISYGYEDTHPHTFELKAHVNKTKNKNKITFFLKSGGKPFNPLIFQPPKKTANIETASVGGFGILLAKTFMDSIAYTYEEGLNQLILTKNL